MSHSVRLVIGRHADVAAFVARWPQTQVVPLLGEWSAAPLTDDLYDALAAWRPASIAPEAFDMAPPGLAEALSEATAEGGPLAYAETEYFGGSGEQSGGAWVGGRLARAELGHGSINAALHAIGVIDADGMDAFDTIGLGRRRSNDAYLGSQAQRESRTEPASEGAQAGIPLWIVVAAMAAAIVLGMAAALL